MKKTISLTLLLLCALVAAPTLRAADNGTEFFLEDDLTVYGAQGTQTDPDVEIKGFSVYGATQTAPALQIPVGPGNIFVNGYVQVSSGMYVAGNSTFTSISAITSIDAGQYQINGTRMLAILGGTGSMAVGATPTLNTGNHNSYLGMYAAGSATGGYDNSFLGYFAGSANNLGVMNSYLGSESARYSKTGSGNVAVGYRAGYGVVDQSFSSNTMVGSQSGIALSTGSDNTLIGFQAGANLTTGGRNIVIGYGQGAASPAGSNGLNIGGLLFGDLSSRTVGISTRAPQAALDVVSTGTASDVYVQIWRNSAGTIVASMTSTGFYYGNGSGLTGGSATDVTKLPLTGGMLSGPLEVGNNSTMTVAGNAFSVGGSTLVVAAGKVGIGVSAPTALLDVRDITAASGYVLRVGAGVSTALVVTTGGIVGVGTTLPSTMTVFHAHATASDHAGGAEDVTAGLMGTVRAYGTGAEDAAVGGNFRAEADGVQNIGHLAGVYTVVERTSGGTGTVARAIGLYVGDIRNSEFGTGRITDTYGVYIGTMSTYNQTNAPYSIYALDPGARSYFAGKTGFGTANPQYALEISSAAGSSDPMLVVSTGGVTVFGVKGNGEVYTSGKFIGDGSSLSGITAADNTKLPLSGGVLSGTLSVFSDTATMPTDIITTGIIISTGGAIQTTGIGHGNIPGDSRGLGAIDLQTARNTGLQAATGLYSVISGGRENKASGPYAVVGGGIGNSSLLTAGFVGAGMYNSAGGNEAAVAGGSGNIASGDSSFIGGGMNNRVSGQYGVVVGGYQNVAEQEHSAIVGGWLNTASGMDSFVGGGKSNHANGSYSVIPGGAFNSATAAYSFAAGFKSSSTVMGSFTWADSQGVETINTVPDQVMFKAAGGFWVSTGTVHTNPGLFVDANNNVGIGTDTPGVKLEVTGGAIKAAGGLILETRTSDPGAPVIGQTWIRADIP
ncbi:MAG TPA: hypothetical protein DCS63_02365 [Elusimicrobia bacterium]|nr:hypothetical protein [Elusimicrobiota bacterium]